MTTITRYHTLSCPSCDRQKMVAIPSVTRFYCCKNFDVTIELKCVGMLTDIVETWAPIVPETKKVTRLPRYGSDPQEWGVEVHQASGAFVLINEYGELVDNREFTSWQAAEEALHEAIVDELTAREDHGPDR